MPYYQNCQNTFISEQQRNTFKAETRSRHVEETPSAFLTTLDKLLWKTSKQCPVSTELTNHRSQINLMIWPGDHVHSQLHNITVINSSRGKPLRGFIFICTELSDLSGDIFQDFVHFGEVKVANYCHHCPWKCITPHLRAHSIKETEGAINRWLLTSTRRKKKIIIKKSPKNGPDSNQHFSFSCVLQTFLLLTSNLGHQDGSSGFGTLNTDFYHHCLKTDLTLLS